MSPVDSMSVDFVVVVDRMAVDDQPIIQQPVPRQPWIRPHGPIRRLRTKSRRYKPY